MKTTSIFRLLAAMTLLVALVGCGADHNPMAPAGPDPDAFADVDKDAGSVVINNFLVTFDGRTVDEAGTTFHYTVAGTFVEPDLDWFLLETPECAGELVGWTPEDADGIYTDPYQDVTGLKWKLTLEHTNDNGRQYAVTYAGDVPLGIIRAVVKAGNRSESAEIYGPCAGTIVEHTAAGTVFADVNEDGQRDPVIESGLADVVLEILSDGALVDTVRTDADGAWSASLAPGTYTVRVDQQAYPDDFNSQLDGAFMPTTPVEIEITVGPDADGLDFGFAPLVDAILENLENGEYVSDAEDRRFWKRQLRAAMRESRHCEGSRGHRQGRGHTRYYTPDEMMDILIRLQGLYFADPYVLRQGHEFEDALRILQKRPRTPLEELLQEMFVTELNEVTGRGITGQEGVQSALIAWGEGVVREEIGDQEGKGLSADKDTTRLLGAIQIFRGINTGGGGGVDE